MNRLIDGIALGFSLVCAAFVLWYFGGTLFDIGSAIVSMF